MIDPFWFIHQPPPLPPPPPTMTQRFANCIENLISGIGKRGRHPHEDPPEPIAGPLLLLIHLYLRRLGKRFAALAAKVADGTLRPAALRTISGVVSRARRACAAPPPGEGAAEAVRARLPSRFKWMSRVARPEAALVASFLRQLLGTPEMAALVAADPQRFGRLLRPLCNALGISPDEGGLIALPALPARARAPRRSRALPVSPMPRPGYERMKPCAPPVPPTCAGVIDGATFLARFGHADAGGAAGIGGRRAKTA